VRWLVAIRWLALVWLTLCGQVNHLVYNQHQGQIAFHPFCKKGESSIGPSDWAYSRARSPASGGRQHCDPVWQVTLCSSEMGFL